MRYDRVNIEWMVGQPLTDKQWEICQTLPAEAVKRELEKDHKKVTVYRYDFNPITYFSKDLGPPVRKKQEISYIATNDEENTL